MTDFILWQTGHFSQNYTINAFNFKIFKSINIKTASFLDRKIIPALAAMHVPYSLSVAFVHRHSTVYFLFFLHIIKCLPIFTFLSNFKSIGYEISYLQNVTPTDNKTLSRNMMFYVLYMFFCN